VNQTESKGYLGEIIAVCLLKVNGYKILARRYKTVCGEIDIIAQKRDVIAFIEVKSRKTIDKCYNAVRGKQLERIRRASQIFISRRNLFEKFPRYDVILIANWKFPTHIENVSI
jgi:putative endonuclease